MKSKSSIDRKVELTENRAGFCCNLDGFKQESCHVEIDQGKGLSIATFTGKLTQENVNCPQCGHKLQIKSTRIVRLRHIPIENVPSVLEFPHHKRMCKDCGTYRYDNITFRHGSKRYTEPLYHMLFEYAQAGCSLKELSSISGLGIHTVRNILKEMDVELSDHEDMGNESLTPKATAAEVKSLSARSDEDEHDK